MGQKGRVGILPSANSIDWPWAIFGNPAANAGCKKLLFTHISGIRNEICCIEECTWMAVYLNKMNLTCIIQLNHRNLYSRGTKKLFWLIGAQINEGPGITLFLLHIYCFHIGCSLLVTSCICFLYAALRCYVGQGSPTFHAFDFWIFHFSRKRDSGAHCRGKHSHRRKGTDKLACISCLHFFPRNLVAQHEEAIIFLLN